MKMNRERDEEMDILYREEARRMWQKREEEWSRERNARKKLMDQVFVTFYVLFAIYINSNSIFSI